MSVLGWALGVGRAIGRYGEGKGGWHNSRLELIELEPLEPLDNLEELERLMDYSTFVVKLVNGTQFEVEAIHHRHAYQIALRHVKSEEIQNIFAKKEGS